MLIKIYKNKINFIYFNYMKLKDRILVIEIMTKMWKLWKILDDDYRVMAYQNVVKKISKNMMILHYQ
jgi:hypothetical protein